MCIQESEKAQFFGKILTELDANHWELYHVEEDFAENYDLAPKRPSGLEKVGEALGLVEETKMRRILAWQ